jgi:hypothetical protein
VLRRKVHLVNVVTHGIILSPSDSEGKVADRPGEPVGLQEICVRQTTDQSVCGSGLGRHAPSSDRQHTSASIKPADARSTSPGHVCGNAGQTPAFRVNLISCEPAVRIHIMQTLARQFCILTESGRLYFADPILLWPVADAAP